MDKLTELHNGVPVIRGKRFDLAAKKLYEYESKLEQGYVLVPLKQILNAAGKAPVPIVFEKPNPELLPIEINPHMFEMDDHDLLLKYSGLMLHPRLLDRVVIVKGGGSDE